MNRVIVVVCAVLLGFAGSAMAGGKSQAGGLPALEERVAALEAGGGGGAGFVLKDADGDVMGPMIRGPWNATDAVGIMLDVGASEPALANFYGSFGVWNRTIFFTTDDCSGQAYADAYNYDNRSFGLLEATSMYNQRYDQTDQVWYYTPTQLWYFDPDDGQLLTIGSYLQNQYLGNNEYEVGCYDHPNNHQRRVAPATEVPGFFADNPPPYNVE